MEREELLNQIQEKLNIMEKWNVNTYISDRDRMNEVNPSFGFKNGDNSPNLSRMRGVTSIWMRAGVKDIQVDILPNGYSGSSKMLRTGDLSDRQLKGILDMVDGICKKEMQNRKQAAMNPKLEELLPRLEAWSKRCTAAAGKQYSAIVSYGKRSNDISRYNAIVIYEDRDQIGSISLRQNKMGQITYNERTPLGGEWMEDDELEVKNIMEPIRESISRIIGKKIDLDATLPQKQLMADIRKNNREWVKNGMTLDLNVKRGKTETMEKWKFNFMHNFSDDGWVSLKLTATPEGVNAPVYVIAKGEFNPEKPGKWVEMEAHGEQVDILYALSKTDKVDEIEYQGWDENNKWMVADVKPMYEEWLHRMNKAYLFSPIRNIHHEVQTSMKLEGELANLIRVSFYGGVQEAEKIIDPADSKLLKTIALWPQYTFMEQMMAGKQFKELVQKYEDANRRITDISMTAVGNKHLMKCRIDGEMQLRQPMQEWQYKALMDATDKEAALTYIASEIFSEELKQEELSRGAKR